jgi:hypothetical protein
MQAAVAGVILALVVLRVLTSTKLFSKPAAAIRQLRRYPGNERWLVVAQDALQRSDITLSDLVADCSASGIGLLMVGRTVPPKVHVEAVRHRERGNKIRKYLWGHEMVETLTATSNGQNSGTACQHLNKVGGATGSGT